MTSSTVDFYQHRHTGDVIHALHQVYFLFVSWAYLHFVIVDSQSSKNELLAQNFSATHREGDDLVRPRSFEQRNSPYCRSFLVHWHAKRQQHDRQRPSISLRLLEYEDDDSSLSVIERLFRLHPTKSSIILTMPSWSVPVVQDFGQAMDYRRQALKQP